MIDWFTIPEVFPEIENLLWYYCTIQAFNGGNPPNTCAGLHLGNWSACIRGDRIINWIDTDKNCRLGQELIFINGFTAQRLIGVVGPYGSLALCNAAH